MYLAYFDESGDDGYPKYSSELFVLTSIYMHYQNWKENYEVLHSFRKQLKTDFNLPVKTEFHTKQFITNKNPYRQFALSDAERKEILFLFFECLRSLDLKVINVVINKKNISTGTRYPVLSNALTYNVQRIENDLRKIDTAHKFMIITDEGRVGKMRKITRRIQRINFIPSKYNPQAYRSEIKQLIEDPLPKPSNESYFIQVADMIAYITYLFSVRKYNGITWPRRVLNVLSYGDERKLLERIEGNLNLEASPQEEFGIVHYPK